MVRFLALPLVAAAAALLASPCGAFSLKMASPVDSLLGKLAGGATKSAEFTVAISGSTGLVGSALAEALAGAQLAGKPVKTLRLVRRAARGDDEVSWDPVTGAVEAEKLEGIDALVHLAGDGVASGFSWSESKKATILDSRVKGTAALVSAIGRLRRPPSTLICASGVGYYGYDSGAQEFDESGAKGGGFLAEVVERWEAEALKAQAKGTRVVCLRTGVVLSPKGGALGRLVPIFKLFAGGALGSGEQYFSWVSLRDLVRIIEFVAASPGGTALRGPVNAVGPAPCTNAVFTRAVGAALSRPTPFPLPEAIGSVLFGQMGEEMLFGGQKVGKELPFGGQMALPKKLERAGFKFQDTDIYDCLKDILN